MSSGRTARNASAAGTIQFALAKTKHSRLSASAAFRLSLMFREALQIYTRRQPMEMKRKSYLIAVLILILDQATKWLASARLDGHEAIEIIPGYLRLSFIRNSGVAFGLFT